MNEIYREERMSAVIKEDFIPIPKQVVNHDIMNCTADGVVGNHLYSGRALGLSEPWDLIQLHPELEPFYCYISSHYKRVGLTHSKQVLWDLDLKHLGAHIGYQPSVFFFGPHECKFWGDQQWMETVDFINSKNNFMNLAAELNVDVPQTICFDDVNAISKDMLDIFTYPCYLKAAISVSGVGIYRCEDKVELIEAIDKFESNVPVQIQEEIITEHFLNMQYQVIGDELIRLTASEQILDGFVHQGNRVPSSHQPWNSVEPMAVWLKDHGIKGIFAFDVAIVQTPKGLRFPAIECNPRFNGASYPTLIAQKLGITEWNSVTLSTKHNNFDQLDFSDIEYNKETGEGMIIVNWGTILVGKLMLLLAGSKEYQEALLVELKSRL